MTKRIGQRMSLTIYFAAAIFALPVAPTRALSARAAETVSIGGSGAVLLKAAAPIASVILMPGSDGRIAAGPGGKIGRLGNNQLVRTRGTYETKGLAVLVVDADVNLAQAVD